ncbi:acyl-CoA dehydrogenase family protein [Candidatus Poriferisodalis multihospitum]|uniref:acyl-CoA dehydrogenase family protein n=1 Tax=Candidatus Poriferisodalis multihospitum TaxID=2983191 RepID=UPI002389D3A9|nr:acyl-CoA dehydrogenase family protein [Candidatus Poriferisodalis multihospitum]MDE0676818.1 acyl-CoA/acyl-ACP dehydrogenase [Acidimicrobiaceae bacterium]
MHAEFLSAAQQLADDVLFERALDVDMSGEVPAQNLDLFRDAGFYGLWTPREVGGCGFDELERLPILEALAGGCLTTAFVWAQHGGGSANAARMPSGSPLHERWARALATGQARSGVAFAHILRPEPCLFAERSGDGWVLRGVAPFVTGWGHIDAVLVAAHEADRLVWMLLPADEAPTLTSQRLRLAAVDSSVTVELHFDGHVVGHDDVVEVIDYEDWLSFYRTGLRTNGALMLGVAGRALKLLGPSPLDAELDAARTALQAAEVEEMPDRRAQVGYIGVRATSALVSSVGGRAITLAHHAQRLAREALFLLVQGQTADIRSGHLRRLGAGPPAS